MARSLVLALVKAASHDRDRFYRNPTDLPAFLPAQLCTSGTSKAAPTGLMWLVTGCPDPLRGLALLGGLDVGKPISLMLLCCIAASI